LRSVPRGPTPSLQDLFPNLRPDNFQLTSPATPKYNCVAFAADDEHQWWEPRQYGGKYHWPPEIPQEDTIEAWTALFLQEGYSLTENSDFEEGYEKVAIYVSLTDMLPSHVAKSDGRAWKSKIGKKQDIRHDSLALLEGEEYGMVDRILRRPLARATPNR